ncbi:MAG TPA: hypothetical protein QF753_15090 [Victivallales bacterium]|nr:hypothetical protein [Victivallales bacterium]
MKYLTIKNLICVTVLFSFISASGVYADEKTGREFNELIKEMNNELSTAKQKVEKIEKQRLAQKKVNPDKVLPERSKALGELEELKGEMDKEKNPTERKVLERQMNDKVIEVSQLSTDFIESMKNDLQSQDQQLEVVESSLSDVVIKMNKLKGIVNGYHNGTNSEAARLTARKNLHKLAQMVEIFAEKHKNAQQWTHVRRTIMLQDRILRKGSMATDTIQNMLNDQQRIYEQVLAQVSIARRALQSEKEILAQVALGEIAKSMLRKAAGLLVGNESIAQIGESAFVESEQRQQQIMNFLEQDQDEGIYTGINMNTGNNISGNYHPDGYEEYLNNGIN